MAAVDAVKLEKKLLKKPQTLSELAGKLDVSPKRLTLQISRLVREGRAVVQAGRPAKYSKP